MGLCDALTFIAKHPLGTHENMNIATVSDSLKQLCLFPETHIYLGSIVTNDCSNSSENWCGCAKDSVNRSNPIILLKQKTKS